MTERTPCRKCGRAIDAMAGRCPYCNWDQAQVPPPPEQVAAVAPAVANYKPPEEMDVRKLIAIGTGILLMLVCAFLIGMVINRDGAPDKAPETVEEQAAEHNAENFKPKRADTPLVPAGQGGIDQAPITSVPATLPPGQATNDYARTDATAVSSAEYAQMARRAAAENASKKRMTVLVDPRSLTGPAYAQGPVRRTASLASTRRPLSDTLGRDPGSPRVVRDASVRTRPIPQYQPIPRVGGHGTARFTLMIGSDGRVKDVNIERTLTGGNTAALIGSIQSWRFKPATENGRAVPAPYSVEISFKP